MKYFYIILCITVCASCTGKTKPSHIGEVNEVLVDTSEIQLDLIPHSIIIDSGQPDFIIDSTLERLYPEDIHEYEFTPSCHWKGGQVQTPEEAFSIVKPYFLDICNIDIELNKPFRINLVDNELWVIYGCPQPNSGIVFGGDIYVEIQKKTGATSPIIIGK